MISVAETDFTPRDLEKVYLDNVRDNQIGGSDGITEETAVDLGFQTHEQTLALIQPNQTGAPQTSPRKLTSAEKNAIERRHIIEHLGTVTKQVLDPDYYRYL